ncbi:MAG: IS701 family transposase, partial [Pyrinomonadaceae bacterium]|nr:IS701 family transposase [Pyrinomonadaceae bacterium]
MNKSLLDLYTDYLISSFGATTATGLSRLLDGAISHDAVTRLLAEEIKTSANLWRVAKPLVRQVESDDGALII